MRAVTAQLGSHSVHEQGVQESQANDPPPSPVRVHTGLADSRLEEFSSEWLTRHASPPDQSEGRVLVWEDAEIGARVWVRTDR